MGNYNQPNIDFVKRTLHLIDQYEILKEQFPFEEQYNHTLLINCLLGLIALPKQKIFSYVPKERLAFLKLLEEWGIRKTTFNPALKKHERVIAQIKKFYCPFWY